MSTSESEQFNCAFRELFSQNPISGFSYSDKIILWSFWSRYRESKERSQPYVEFAERLHNLANEAERFRLLLWQSQQQPEATAFLALCPEMETLVRDLGLFSLCAKAVSFQYGKPDHKSKLARARRLVRISLFIKWRTGHFNDGHLAEFIQGARGIDDSDLSEEMLANIRTRFRRTHPDEYKRIEQDVRNLSEEAPTLWDQFETPPENLTRCLKKMGIIPSSSN